MKDRPYLLALLQSIVTAALAFIGMRYGIPIPPPQFPPIVIPEVPTPPAPERQPDPVNAINRIQFGNAGCTATVIDDQRPDGRYWVLTAAHCIRAVGQRGDMISKNGSRHTVTVVAVNKSADCAWLLTDSTGTHLPFAELASSPPASGTPVWHAGYGVDRPGNRESGTFVSGPDGQGQIKFRLSVSSGDSGGAILTGPDNKVLSCVCCTTQKGTVADVWGAGPQAIRELRQSVVTDFGWEPMDIPIRPIKPELPRIPD